ncbi:MAG: hypothetical protein WBX15_05845 [Thermoanaerobaculia bacterium]
MDSRKRTVVDLERPAVVGLMLFVALAIGGCSTASPKQGGDPRLEVEAALASPRSGRQEAYLLYRVLVRNVSEHTLVIRRVEVEPIGGPEVRNAYVTDSKTIEPGEAAHFEIWAEVLADPSSPDHTSGMARVAVSFDDHGQPFMRSWVVEV